MELNGQILTLRDIPSKFKGYSIKELQIQGFDFDDMRIFSSKRVPEAAVIQLMERTVINFNIYDLSYQDFQFALLANTFFTDPNQKWEWDLECPHCGKPFKAILTPELISQFDDLKAPSLPIYVELNGEEFEFGLYTVRTHVELLDAKKWANFNQDILTLAGCVKNMSIEEAYNKIRKLKSAVDFEVLKEVQVLLNHGPSSIKIKHSDRVKVPKDPENESAGYDVKELCGKEGDHVLKFKGTDLHPFLVDPKLVGARIRFAPSV